MIKEELEHNHIKEIAENYVNECWGTYLDLNEVDLVMAGIGVAKIISKEKEKHIAELEKENAELKERNGELAGQKASLERWFGEAKEIIKKFLLWENDWHNKTESKYELLKQAEQFLKEVEDD